MTDGPHMEHAPTSSADPELSRPLIEEVIADPVQLRKALEEIRDTRPRGDEMTPHLIDYLVENRETEHWREFLRGLLGGSR